MVKETWDSNKKLVLPGAHSFILLSKMTEFSPKNFTFLQIKLDKVVPDTWKLWQIDPWAGADAL